MSTNDNVCPKCGKILKTEWKACPNCGWTLHKKRTSQSAAILSIVCCIIGIFFFGYLFGPLGAGLGLAALKKEKKDKLGYVGIVFGIIVFILSIIVLIYRRTFWF